MYPPIVTNYTVVFPIFRGWKYHIVINFWWWNSGYPSPLLFLCGTDATWSLSWKLTEHSRDTWQHPISDKYPQVFLVKSSTLLVKSSSKQRLHLLVTAETGSEDTLRSAGPSCDGTGSKDSDHCNIEKAWHVRPVVFRRCGDDIGWHVVNPKINLHKWDGKHWVYNVYNKKCYVCNGGGPGDQISLP